jgi:hypothetical protein
LVARLNGFEVVPRVEIEKREALRRVAHIHGIRLQGINA